MCKTGKSDWEADGYEGDFEKWPRGLYRAELTNKYSEVRDCDLVGLTNEPAKIARAIMRGEPPNLIGSKLFGKSMGSGGWPDGLHGPLLDIDIPHRIKRSSTEGHHHLLIDHPINEDDYRAFMKVAAKIGFQQEGFAQQMDRYGQTFLRWECTKDEEI